MKYYIVRSSNGSSRSCLCDSKTLNIFYLLFIEFCANRIYDGLISSYANLKFWLSILLLLISYLLSDQIKSKNKYNYQ